MAIEIKHSFVSLKGDGGDATLVKPSHWNAVHSTSIATNKLVGRLTAGTGAFEEIPFSAYMATLLAAADKNALADMLGLFTTGDVKYTFDTTASAGWLKITGSGSIGNAASGATMLASATALDLFVLIYDACLDGVAPVSGGRTGVALNDFNANKTLRVPDLVGRAPVGAGNATTGTSARVLGTIYGAETHTLTAAQIPSITSGNATQAITVSFDGRYISASSNVQADVSVPTSGGVAARYAPSGAGDWANITSASGNNSISVTSNNTSGLSHNIMQPSIPLIVMVKL